MPPKKSKPTNPPVLGSIPADRGYLNDSMGLGIDKGAYYDWEASEGRLTALWRVGVNKPKNAHIIEKR